MAVLGFRMSRTLEWQKGTHTRLCVPFTWVSTFHKDHRKRGIECAPSSCKTGQDIASETQAVTRRCGLHVRSTTAYDAINSSHRFSRSQASHHSSHSTEWICIVTIHASNVQLFICVPSFDDHSYVFDSPAERERKNEGRRGKAFSHVDIKRVRETFRSDFLSHHHHQHHDRNSRQYLTGSERLN